MSASLRLCRLLTAALLATALPSIAQAQRSSGVSVEQLQEELQRRDALIADLLNRVRVLEAERGSTPSQVAEAPRTGTVETTPTDGGGDFRVDRLAAERALERTLVQQGLSLLAPGRFELTPALGFSRFESDFPALIIMDGEALIGSVDQRLSVAEFSADLRIGLPFDAQLEVGVPYRIVHAQTRTLAGGAIGSSDVTTGAGFGDVEIGLAKAIFDQRGWRPRLIGRLTWVTGTGKEFEDGVFLGGGTSALTGQLSASWRRDPVVFFVTSAYTRYLSNDVLDRENQVGLSLGASLAISPETALLFSLDQSFTDSIESDGVRRPGTDRLSSLLNISVSTILGPRILLRVDAGIGLTGDAPGYRARVSLPVRW